MIGKVPIVIDTSVRPAATTASTSASKNATQTAGLLSSQVTFWGVPGDPRHDNARGWECVAGGFFPKQVGEAVSRPHAGLEEAVPDAADVVRGEPGGRTDRLAVDADSWAEPGTSSARTTNG